MFALSAGQGTRSHSIAMAKDVKSPEFWNKFMQRPDVQAAMRSKLRYESAAEAAQRSQLDRLERKQRRYELMQELMQCATNVKHLISPMFRYKITQQYLWKVLTEARQEGLLFCDKLRQPQVYHRLMAIKAEITAGPFGVAGWQAEEEVEEDLMDRMVVEADCIPGGINGEAPERKQVLDKREMAGVLEFGQQIKSEGNEAFSTDNWEGALTRYCQGDEMLKNFKAEPHLEKENKELVQLHSACLNNKANAALQMDKWQTALKAAEDALRIKQDDQKALFRKAQALEGLGRTDEALEALDEVEQIAEDLEDEFRESILADVRERREEIKDIERKAARDYSKMLRAMGDKKVFGEGRFLADGTSPPPALTGEQERKLKQLRDKDDYLAAKLKHDMEQRKKEGKPVLEPRREPDMLTPNRPGCLDYRTTERSVTITRKQAGELLDELMATYSDTAFQKRVHADARAATFEYQPFLRRLRKTAFVVQEPLLVKWGFDPSEEGLQEMMMCLSDHTMKDQRLKQLAEETTKMLFGGEDGMLGLEA